MLSLSLAAQDLDDQALDKWLNQQYGRRVIEEGLDDACMYGTSRHFSFVNREQSGIVHSMNQAYQTLFLLLLLLLRSSNFSATSLVLLHLSNLLTIVENPYWMYENEKMTKKARVQGAATFQK